ncbi:MAG: hypothetical protein QM728_01465 [Gordonia sp. (in: high G+C Gram-positive bacteria)]|uniref:hypothetical protein n=1 Tax=Gordonia sp. (in: high G+C Gram-positive bacteria) TaxID=84139 RepID=UPI0039E251B0
MSTLKKTVGVAAGLAVAATAAATLAPAPAHAASLNFPVYVSGCGGGQACPKGAEFPVFTGGALRVQFISSPKHCSTIVAKIAVDNRPVVRTLVKPGQPTAARFLMVPAGTHKVRVTALGVPGGCNKGALSSWGGTLAVQTDLDALMAS